MQGGKNKPKPTQKQKNYTSFEHKRGKVWGKTSSAGTKNFSVLRNLHNLTSF